MSYTESKAESPPQVLPTELRNVYQNLQFIALTILGHSTQSWSVPTSF